jgi:hypothetical protein
VRSHFTVITQERLTISIGYVVMLFPSTIAVSWFGPGKWLPFCELCWGIVTCFLSIARDAKTASRTWIGHVRSLLMLRYMVCVSWSVSLKDLAGQDTSLSWGEPPRLSSPIIPLMPVNGTFRTSSRCVWPFSMGHRTSVQCEWYHVDIRSARLTVQAIGGTTGGDLHQPFRSHGAKWLAMGFPGQRA